jgi:hypothetical protein
MNLSWMLFEAGDNALGGVWSNVFRVMTIVLVIFFTFRYKFKKGQKWEINKNTLLVKV